MLKVEKLDFYYHKNKILENINLEIDIKNDNEKKGKIIAIIGANGAGKSTLLKIIAGLVPYKVGDIYLNYLDKNYNLKKTSFNVINKHICYMPQDYNIDASIKVIDLIILSKKLFYKDNTVYFDDIINLLKEFNFEHIANKYVNELSGGQKQIVSLMQVLIRDAKILLLDEPISAMDLYYQIRTLNTIKRIINKNQVSCIIAMHDLNMSLRYADEIIAIKNGKLLSYGSTKNVISEDLIKELYNVNVQIIKIKDYIQIIPLSTL